MWCTLFFGLSQNDVVSSTIDYVSLPLRHARLFISVYVLLFEGMAPASALVRYLAPRLARSAATAAAWAAAPSHDIIVVGGGMVGLAFVAALGAVHMLSPAPHSALNAPPGPSSVPTAARPPSSPPPRCLPLDGRSARRRD